LSAQFVALNQTLIRVAFSLVAAVIAGVLLNLL
jgi:archaellin